MIALFLRHVWRDWERNMFLPRVLLTPAGLYFLGYLADQSAYAFYVLWVSSLQDPVKHAGM